MSMSYHIKQQVTLDVLPEKVSFSWKTPSLNVITELFLCFPKDWSNEYEAVSSIQNITAESCLAVTV